MTDKQKDEGTRYLFAALFNASTDGGVAALRYHNLWQARLTRADKRIAELEALVASNIVVHDQEADGPTASLLEHLRAERDRYKEALELDGPDRFSLRGIIGGLMVAENLGDVHDEINLLCDLAGISHPEGDFLHGWTDQDWRNLEDDARATLAPRRRPLLPHEVGPAILARHPPR